MPARTAPTGQRVNAATTAAHPIATAMRTSCWRDQPTGRVRGCGGLSVGSRAATTATAPAANPAPNIAATATMTASPADPVDHGRSKPGGLQTRQGLAA
jgi:hypothetical protein